VTHRESNGHVTDDVNCLAIIRAKNNNNIAAVQFEINLHSSLILFIRTLYCISYRIHWTDSFEHYLVMGPSFLEGGPIMCWSCPSVCLSVPCLHLEGKRKGLRIPNLVGRVPGTPAPSGPISRSRGQRSRSRRTKQWTEVKRTQMPCSSVAFKATSFNWIVRLYVNSVHLLWGRPS